MKKRIRWSKMTIIARIQERAQQGLAINSNTVQKEDSSLANAGRNHFGSWKKAVEAAGFDYQKINKYSDRTRWSKMTIIARIQERVKNNLEINTQTVTKEDNALYQSASSYFGSWKKAVEAAGFDYQKINKYSDRTRWSKTHAIKLIRNRESKGLTINSSNVQKEDPTLYTSSCKLFGNWKAAIEAAGFDYQKVHKQAHFVRWSRDLVLACILERAITGKALSLRAVRRGHPALIGAAGIHFGSWKKAVEAAGLNYEKIRELQFWSRDLIVARIQERVKKGFEINYRTAQDSDAHLVEAGRNHFGSWKKAVEAAGFDYSKICKVKFWSEELVIARIQERAQQGLAINSNTVQKEDSSLANAGRNHFGSWKKAVEAAGFDYSHVIKVWTLQYRSAHLRKYQPVIEDKN